MRSTDEAEGGPLGPLLPFLRLQMMLVRRLLFVAAGVTAVLLPVGWATSRLPSPQAEFAAEGLQRGATETDEGGFTPGPESGLTPLPLAWDLGALQPWTTASGVFHLRNESLARIRIVRIHAPCSCTVVHLDSTWVDPGKTVPVRVTFDAWPPFGRRQTSLLVHTSAAVLRVPVWADVRGPDHGLVVPSPSSLDLGILPDDTTVRRRATLTLMNPGRRPYTIDAIHASQGLGVAARLPVVVPAGESAGLEVEVFGRPASLIASTFDLEGHGGPRRAARVAVRGLMRPAPADHPVPAIAVSDKTVLIFNPSRTPFDLIDASNKTASSPSNASISRLDAGGVLALPPDLMKQLGVLTYEAPAIGRVRLSMAEDLPKSAGPVIVTGDRVHPGYIELCAAEVRPETTAATFNVMNLSARTVHIERFSIDVLGQVAYECPDTVPAFSSGMVRILVQRRAADGTVNVRGRVGWRDDSGRKGSVPFAVSMYVKRPSVAQSVLEGAVPVRLMAVSEQLGTLAPCNCDIPMTGGFPRLVGLVEQSRRDTASLLLQIGDFSGDDVSTSDRKARAVLGILKLAQPVVVIPGEQELVLGPEKLQSIQADADVPLIACNVARVSDGSPAFPPHAMISTHGLRVGVIGIVDPRATDDDRVLRAGFQVLSAGRPLKDAVSALAGQCDAMGLAVYGPHLDVGPLLAQHPELVFVVRGRGEGRAVTGSFSDGVAVFETERHGTVLATSDMAVRPRAALVAASFRRVDVVSGITPDPRATTLLEKYKAELRTLPSPPLDPSPPQYSTDASACAPCHRAAYESWRQSAHSRAYETLVHDGDQFDPDCLRCHTVGFNTANGFRADQPTRMVGVQCESCHGPSAAHALDPVSASPPGNSSDSCATCHTPENSPRFAFDVYWRRIRHDADVTTGPESHASR